MGEEFTWRTKRQIELIPVSISLDKDLADGEVISSCDVSIEVFSGEDSDPSTMLYKPVDVTDTECVQDIWQGVIGVVYKVIFAITTSSGQIITRTTKIGILPDNIPATGKYIPLYFTTWRYPLDVTGDYFIGSADVVSGRTLEKLHAGPDWIQGFPAVQSGTITLVRITYNFEDYIQPLADVTSGLYELVRITYTMDADWMQASPDVTSGILRLIHITYTTPIEYIQGTPSVQSGTLTL